MNEVMTDIPFIPMTYLAASWGVAALLMMLGIVLTARKNCEGIGLMAFILAMCIALLPSLWNAALWLLGSSIQSGTQASTFMR